MRNKIKRILAAVMAAGNDFERYSLNHHLCGAE